MIAPKKYFAAMHTGAGEVAHDALAIRFETKHNDDTACLVFAQKASGGAADDHHRHLFLVSLHVDAGTIAGVALDQDLATAHGITGSITDVAVDDDLTFIHGIADSVLRVGIDRYGGTVEVGTQGVSGNPLNGDLSVGHTCGNEPLTKTVDDMKIAFTLPNGFVEHHLIQIFRIYQHCYITPFL